MFGNMNRLLFSLQVIALVSIHAVPAWSERIWDAELKRFLTDQEMTMAEIFMTEEEAVKTMFAKSLSD
jgi:hypothetical protein